MDCGKGNQPFPSFEPKSKKLTRRDGRLDGIRTHIPPDEKVWDSASELLNG